MDSIIQQIADLAIQAVAIAWRAQGHELTGNAVRQMETKITKTAQGYQIDGYVTDYMASLNTGVPASRIPYSPGSGARSSKYIQGLMDYAKRRMGASDKEAQKIAFAIASRHKREGMPTKASARYSSTGKRTQFIQDALQDKEAQFAELIERAVEESFNVIFTSSLQNALGR
jgi:hypothetical protein